MVHYEFMKPENLQDKVAIHKHVKEKYGVELLKELLDENNFFLHEYLKNLVERYQTETYLERVLKRQLPKNIFQDVYTENLISKLKGIVYNPSEYVGDLISAIYMGIRFNDPKQDSFLMSVEIPPKRPGESKSAYKRNVEFIQRFKKEREEINSVWERKSNSNKIDKNCVRMNYPIPIQEKDEEEHTIASIPGGCFQYHKVLISMNHLGLFDTRTNITDYKRYSFMKMHQIYNKLKKSTVENLLLMEYSLGIGFANHIYAYISDVSSYSDWIKLSEIVMTAMQLSPFFIRKKISMPILEYIKLKGYEEEYYNEVIKILSCVNEAVNHIYEEILELWWYEHYLFQNEDSIYRMICLLRGSWERYYSEEQAFSDSISYCGISDWRGIKKAGDCFFYLDGYPNFEASERRESIWEKLYLVPVTFYDSIGESKSIYVENIIDSRINSAANSIGKKIIEEVTSRMFKGELPKERAEVYKMYYAIREEVFRDLRESEKKIFYKKDIKKPTEKGIMKPQHVYAVLQEEIIQSLLKTR